MHRAPDQVVALERARWLAELGCAVVEAQKLAWRLGVVDGDSAEARKLYTRLEAVRLELDALKFNGWVAVRHEVDSSWLDALIHDNETRAAANDRR
jgi:hypothetical protein